MSQSDSPSIDLTDGQANAPVTEAEAEKLRAEKYNATIIWREDAHPELAKFRIRPDAGFAPFLPGQYVAIGLGNWEPRIADTQVEEVPEKRRRKIVRRAYSISCPLVDEAGNPVSVNSIDYLEFYVTLVRRASSPEGKPPALTPRLFGKKTGDRVVLEKKITGHYTLGEISPTDTVLMLGTGTGEAPHNAMAAELLANSHTGKIVIATSLRYKAHTGYMDQHARLMKAFPQYRYFPLTTREPENLDPAVSGFVGKQYLQKLWTSGELAEKSGDSFDPSNTHVFLCGNPAMIGYVPPGEEPPESPGMLPLLKKSGFVDDAKSSGPGHVRYEKYW